MNIKTNNKITDKALFYFCIIDMLFFPYIRVLSIKASMLIVMLWYINGGFNKAFNKKSLIRFLTFVFLSIISVLIGILINSKYFGLQFLLLSNIQILIIIWFAYLFLYYYKYHFSKYELRLEKILLFYILFALITAMIFWQNPQLFYDIRRHWTLGNENITFIHSTFTRYMHIASEPNNFAAMMIAIIAYLRYVEEIDRVKMFIVYIVSFIIIITTMSTTGIVMFIALTLIEFIPRKRLSVRFKTKNVLIGIFSAFLIFLCFIIFNDFVSAFFESDIVRAATLRYNVYIENENYSGSRLDIWINLLKEVNIMWNILVGRGTTIISEGIIYKSHNGHLFIIYGYGLIAYIYFMYEFFFWKRDMQKKEYLSVVLPFLIIFTMNTMFGDLRCVFLFILLLSKISSGYSFKKDCEKVYLNN